MYTLRFEEPDCRIGALVGGKGLGLAEMVGHGLPVAPGFVVTVAAHESYLTSAGLDQELAAILASTDSAHPESLGAAETSIAALFAYQPLPIDVARAIRSGYRNLCNQVGVDDVSVAVRSSATAEDSVNASFAGEFETWVDVLGVDQVLEYVRLSYIAVYAGRALAYMIENGLDPHSVRMAVVVQKTVRARAAGVMFTLDPMSGDRSKIAIEANWGLGLSVVGGEVTPDRYTVEKVGLRISSRVLGDKQMEYRQGDRATEVPMERRSEFCLADSEVLALAALGKRLERLHGSPQDIEFAVDDELKDPNNVVLLQCRPETIWSSRPRTPLFDPGASPIAWLTASITRDLQSTPSSSNNEVRLHD